MSLSSIIGNGATVALNIARKGLGVGMKGAKNVSHSVTNEFKGLHDFLINPLKGQDLFIKS